MIASDRASMGRRGAPAGMAGATALPLLGRASPARAQPVQAQLGSDKRHAGTRVSILFQESPRSDLLAASLREFADLTGIKLVFEVIPEQQQWQKMVVEFASGAPSFDVANISVAVQKRHVERGGWFADLRPLFAQAAADPAFDGADSSPATLAYGSGKSGRLEVLPVNLDYWVVHYNKELLEGADPRVELKRANDRYRPVLDASERA